MERAERERMWRQLIQVLDNAVIRAKREYYAGTPGYTYDTMREAAKRALETKRKAELDLYGKATTKVSARAISDYIR